MEEEKRKGKRKKNFLKTKGEGGKRDERVFEGCVETNQQPNAKGWLVIPSAEATLTHTQTSEHQRKHDAELLDFRPFVQV